MGDPLTRRFVKMKQAFLVSMTMWKTWSKMPVSSSWKEKTATGYTDP